jgi:hypothetical protein
VGGRLFESIFRADASQTRKDRAILRVIEATPWTPETTGPYLEQIVRIGKSCPSGRTRLRAVTLIIDLTDPVEAKLSVRDGLESMARWTGIRD